MLLTLICMAVVLLATGGILWWQRQQNINNGPLTWDECIKIPGVRMLLMYPGRCVTSDGREVTQPISDAEKKNLQPPTTSSK